MTSIKYQTNPIRQLADKIQNTPYLVPLFSRGDGNQRNPVYPPDLRSVLDFGH